MNIGGEGIRGIPDATEIVKGKAELATNAEAAAKTVTDKVLVPSNIPSVMAEPGSIGKTTPDRGIFKPLEAKGPAAITTFDGTASRTGTNLTFTSEVDAVKAGYDATNPTLGTIVVLGGNTMVILSWSSATVAVVDVSGDIAGTIPTSVQAPLVFGKNDSGVLKWAILASGNLYIAGKAGFGTTEPEEKSDIVGTAKANDFSQKMQQLTDEANISWDMADGGFAYVTLDGNRTLSNPTNVKAGARYILKIIQDDTTGGRTLAYGANFKFPGGVAPTLSSGVSDVDLLEFVAYNATTLYLVNAIFDI